MQSSSRRPRIVLTVLAVIAALVATPLALLACYSSPQVYPLAYAQFQLRRTEFEAVVERARRLHLQPGQQASKAGQGIAWASCTSTGALQIGIITADHGHAGIVGFIYSETRIAPDSHLDVPSPLFIVGQPLVTNWWTAYNNLD